ncbi:MAG: amino acid permease [Colwellia sp.]|nr:amino acid permease [Colwellia sp.]
MSVKKSGFGLWTATSMVVGGMIGSGIFLLPSALASFGGISIVGWIFTSVGSLTLAYVFASLSKYVRGSGGSYIYTRAAFGDFMGFSVCWGYWICMIAANAAISIALVSYLSVFIPILKQQSDIAALTTLLFLWSLVWVNLRGLKEVGKLQLVTTILKFIPLFLVALVGCFYLNTDHFVPFNLTEMSSYSAVSAASALTMWSFLGLETANNVAGDVIDPEKNVPKAALLGTGICAFVYILGSISVMGLIEPAVLSKSNAPFADAAAILWGDWGYYFIGVCAVVSCLGALNCWTLCLGQVPMAASRDGLFPKVFGEKSKRKVPAKGIIISTLLVSGLVLMNFNESLVDQFTLVILLSTFATVIPYLLCTLAHFTMSLKNRNPLGLTPFSAVITTIATLFSIWIIANLGTETIVMGFILLIAGIPVFFFTKYQANQSALNRNEL